MQSLFYSSSCAVKTQQALYSLFPAPCSLLMVSPALIHGGRSLERMGKEGACSKESHKQQQCNMCTRAQVNFCMGRNTAEKRKGQQRRKEQRSLARELLGLFRHPLREGRQRLSTHSEAHTQTRGQGSTNDPCKLHLRK